MNPPGWTSHGHPIPGAVQHRPFPDSRARCGGVGICSVCAREAGRYLFDQVGSAPDPVPRLARVRLQRAHHPAGGWVWWVIGTSGYPVMSDDHRDYARALTDALKARAAVQRVEDAGHVLESWRDVVDAARA